MSLHRIAGAALFAAISITFPALALAAGPFDGFWMIVKSDKSLDPGSQVEYHVDKHTVTMTSPMGASYHAKLDGSDSPMENDANTTSVSVKLEGKHTLVETLKNNGKAWRVVTMEVLSDGKTAKVTWKNLKDSQSGGYSMAKQ
jgi:hypothetical protein